MFRVGASRKVEEVPGFAELRLLEQTLQCPNWFWMKGAELTVPLGGF